MILSCIGFYFYFFLFILVMAKKVGITTTDCNYFDYLRIEKSRRRSHALQKLQRKLDTSLLDLTNYVEEIAANEVVHSSAKEELYERLSVPADMVEVNTVVEGLVLEENGGAGDNNTSMFDPRDIRLAVLVATSKDGLNTLVDNCYRLFDPSLGDDSIAKITCSKILQKHLFLSLKVNYYLNKVCRHIYGFIYSFRYLRYRFV